MSKDEHSYENILNFTNIARGDSGDYTCETKNRCGKESRNESINVFCKFWDVKFGINVPPFQIRIVYYVYVLCI